MSSTSLPPLPALIPISVLRKSPLSNNNSEIGDEHHVDCSPCINNLKVSDEQRSPRLTAESSDVLIDNEESRDTSAAPQPRKIRPERHRKSNRQRDHRRRAKTKSALKKHLCSDQPINPRVNPIFVWVRQEDTRIVEVKCEDYDKRNRILLTKTPQGWRATPRTETLVPSLKEEDDRKHHRRKKSKRNRIKQKSAAVQVDNQDQQEESAGKVSRSKDPNSLLDWESPVNVESLLPSHTIHVHKKDSSYSDSEQSYSIRDFVESEVTHSAQVESKCSVEKICDSSPLENLLAVAELEFNEQIQSGGWNEIPDDHQTNNKVIPVVEQNIFIKDMEHLENLIESCTQDDKIKMISESNIHSSHKEECDYTEDEENNLAMNDILNRLEQSLRSPESSEMESAQCDTKEQLETESESLQVDSNQYDEVGADHCDNLLGTYVPTYESDIHADKVTNNSALNKLENLIEKSSDNILSENIKQEEPTDLSLKSMRDLTIEIPPTNDYFEQPTDLSIPKQNKITGGNSSIYRPPSQNSEALQSPQPSGLPAILPSPGIPSPGTTVNMTTNVKEKSTLLEIIPANSMAGSLSKIDLINEGQKAPLDLGKCRKSASPTVTCSEEVNNSPIEDQPPSKKLKISKTVSSINILDSDQNINEDFSPISPRISQQKENNDSSPMRQLSKLLLDDTLNIPDPMLVPKKSLRKIISNPGSEIPELLKKRPELRLPEALEFPHLLQDPDILVITIQQLEEIIKQQSSSLENLSKTNSKNDKPDKILEKKVLEFNNRTQIWRKGKDEVKKPFERDNFSKNHEELSGLDFSEIEMSSNAALNQILWLPYMNQFETSQFGGNSDIIQMLTNPNMVRTMPALSPNFSHLNMLNSRIPAVPGNFRIPNYNNPFEMHLWQSSMIQSALLGQKNPSNKHESRSSFEDLMKGVQNDNFNGKYFPSRKFSMENQYAMQNQIFQTPSALSTLSNTYTNHPQACQVNMKTSSPIFPQFNRCLQKSMAEQISFQNQKISYSHQRCKQEKPYNHKITSNVHLQQKTNKPNHVHYSKEKYVRRQSNRSASQPIDLSGASSTVGVKSKIMQQLPLIDSLNTSKHSRNDDVGEVGSTTASIEEMQEAHKHLWHPLFGK